VIGIKGKSSGKCCQTLPQKLPKFVENLPGVLSVEAERLLRWSRPQAPLPDVLKLFCGEIYAWLNKLECLTPWSLFWMAGNHRYQKSKIDCLRFVMCPLLAPVFQGFFFFFFAVAINSTNEANKAGGTHL